MVFFIELFLGKGSFFQLGLYFTKELSQMLLAKRINKGCIKTSNKMEIPNHQKILLFLKETPNNTEHATKVVTKNATDKA